MKLHSLSALGIVLLAATDCCTAQPALKDTFKDKFLIGTALNPRQFTGQDQRGVELIKTHFNSVTPENVLKWALVHPRPGTNGYDFDAADRFVEFGERNGMTIIGHTLVWHSQTPRWVFEGNNGQPATRDQLLERMRDHIHTVVGRYKGRIKGWDVVNEALNEDGTLRQSPWLRIIGEDYLVKAFEYTREADPQAELYYNDYSLENEPKRNGTVALVKKIQSHGVKVDGIGTQQHVKMDWPTISQVDDTIAAFAALGVKVMITELDVDVLPAATRDAGADVATRLQMRAGLNPYSNGLPATVQQELADRYADLFRAYLRHSDKITRVTLWGVTDGDSWLNNWPIRGRTSYPLLFDRQGKPKPAFDAVINTAR
ncbi:MAG TPA: endo-1,4-beta-xylanase [Verrucomicrobiota bacterium]|nr:endo-1,4-beta-xylanase [Verrucomicrobiota bacterium]